MELNPNHPTTRVLSDQWHKIAALLMKKLEVDHVVITASDIHRLSGEFIAAEERHDGLHLSLVDAQTAMRMARTHGGLLS